MSAGNQTVEERRFVESDRRFDPERPITHIEYPPGKALCGFPLLKGVRGRFALTCVVCADLRATERRRPS